MEILARLETHMADGELELQIPVTITRVDGGIRVMVSNKFNPEVE